MKANDELPAGPLMRDRKEIAEVVYRELKDSERSTFEISAAYGRWLINSLFLIHSGALFGMFTFLAALAPSPEKVSLYSSVVWWLITGLSSALLSGFATWLNWSEMSDYYNKIAEIRMLWDGDYWPDFNKKTPKITFTYWASITLGFFSFFCLWFAAMELMSGKGLLNFLSVTIH